MREHMLKKIERKQDYISYITRKRTYVCSYNSAILNSENDGEIVILFFFFPSLLFFWMEH